MDSIDYLIRRCYKYVKNFKPQKESPKDIGDEFEDEFEKVIPNDIEILSKRGEFRFGVDIPSASGLKHEIDKVLQLNDILIVIEFKHKIIDPVKKNPFLIFWAKVMDYYLSLIRSRWARKLYVLFLTCETNIPDEVRFFCYRWGINLIDTEIRPPDVLVFLSKELLEKKKEGFFLDREETYILSIYKRTKKLCQNVRKNFGEILYQEPSSFKYARLNLDMLPTQEISKNILKEQKQLNKEIEELLKQYRAEGGT